MEHTKKYGYDYVTIDENGDLYAFEYEPIYRIDKTGGYWDEGKIDGKVVFLGESDYIGDEYHIVDVSDFKLRN